MRFCFYNLTTTTKLGGVETCCWELGRELAKQGHQVHIMGGQGDFRAHSGTPGLEVFTFPFTPRERIPDLGSRFRKMGERLSMARHALGSLISGNYHAIIMVKPYDIGPALIARTKSKARLCYYSGGGEFFTGYAFLARKLDYFCACSAYDAGDIQAHTKVRPHVNHYGVDSESFRPMQPDPELARRWGVDPNEPLMASAVRLVAFKGIDVALRALALARQSLPNLRYLIAGDGPEKERLQNLVSALDLERAVIFTGPLPHHQLPAFYSLAQVGLFPSIEKEALGIAAGEAMSCGLATVVTQVGGLPEMVSPGTGLMVPPKDPQALADAMAELFSGPEKLAQSGQACRRRIEEDFTWAACADRLLQGLGLR